MDGSIGDIAIAGETVMREAAEAGIAAGDHLLHLFTHGVLHLLGYDHIDDQMADEMEALEIALLGQMKVANPYLDDEPALARGRPDNDDVSWEVFPLICSSRHRAAMN
jgi:ssRNA-specific RNase YbeY (16S rRNA maturation enzyme)